MIFVIIFFFKRYGNHRELHVLTHSFPTRRSSDLSDAAIETADVVIQTDQPSRISTAIMIGKATKRVVWQNIGLAFGVKAIVLALGAAGVAGMWEAVFADVGEIGRASCRERVCQYV